MRREYTREELEALLRDAGHAINANNGKCALIENVLCRVTGLCCALLAELAKPKAEAPRKPLVDDNDVPL